MRKVILTIKDSTGKTYTKEFKNPSVDNRKEAIWFLHNEGDHVRGFHLEEIDDETEKSTQPGTETL